jgi:type VI secretion system secreted protein VgrG
VEEDGGYNLYVFVVNNPAIGIDALGLLEVDPPTIITIGTGGTATGTAVCRTLIITVPTVAAGIAALPVTAIVLSAVIVGEAVVITYELCDTCKKKKCPECKPYPAGTPAYEIARVRPLGQSKLHKPWPGDHIHWYKVNQNPDTCECYWRKDKRAGQKWTDAKGVVHQDETAPIIPNGSAPNVPLGTLQVPPFPVLTY